MEKKVIKVDSQTNERVDKYIKFFLPQYSREYIKFLCKSGFVKIDNQPVVPKHKVKPGSII